MTAHEAIALLPYWQKRLRLQDWTIRIKIVTQTEGNPMGQARHTSMYKDAEITILEPVNIPDSWLGEKNPEVTLVHELLHLQAESLNALLERKKHKRYETDYERLVELTAIALVNMRRELELVTAERDQAQNDDRGIL